MNKLIAVVIVIGLVLSAAARAEGLACNDSCVSVRSQCIQTLGAESIGNCSDGFRLCVQRCDPRRMNTALLERNFNDARLNPKKADRIAMACGDHCAMSARLCVEGGNPGKACHAAQTACTERCASN